MRLSIVVLFLFLGFTPARSETAATNLKSMNIRANPLALLFGIFNLDIDFGVSDTATLGPSLLGVTWKVNDTTYSGGALGIRSNFYLGHKRFTDSWLVGPYLDFASVKISQPGYQDVTIRGTALGSAIAYQWVWSSGFNIDLGATLTFWSFPTTTTLVDNNGNTTNVSTTYTGAKLGLEFCLGYAF